MGDESQRKIKGTGNMFISLFWEVVCVLEIFWGSCRTLTTMNMDRVKAALLIFLLWIFCFNIYYCGIEERRGNMGDDYWRNICSESDEQGNESHRKSARIWLVYVKHVWQQDSHPGFIFKGWKVVRWVRWDCLGGAGTHRPSLLIFITCRWQRCAIIASLCVCRSCQDQREEAHFVEAEVHHGRMTSVTWDSQIIL